MREVLTFEEFTDYIRENLLIHWWEDREITIKKVTKNNGRQLTSLTVTRVGQTFFPTFYLEDFYEYYRQDPKNHRILQEIRESFENAEKVSSHMDIEKMFSYEAVCDKIVFRVINYEKNKETLIDCPYVRMYDLAVTFRILCSMDDISVSSTLITNDNLEDWGVSKEEVLLRAHWNTRRMFPVKLRSMAEALIHFEEEEIKADSQDCFSHMMYILSNEQLMNGASVILYENLLEELSDKLKASYYLLPSSIHEMILIPDFLGLDENQLLEMVYEVNRSLIEEEDFLSDSVYYYNRERSRLECYDAS